MPSTTNSPTTIAGAAPAADPTLTKRQREVLERLALGGSVRQIANDIGVTRNAVYQTIDRLRDRGALPETFTASGQPPRRLELGAAALGPATAAGSTRLAEVRELATGDDEAAHAEAVERAIADGDLAVLAYELGRADAAGRDELASRLVEAALRRLGALTADQPIR